MAVILLRLAQVALAIILIHHGLAQHQQDQAALMPAAAAAAAVSQAVHLAQVALVAVVLETVELV